MAKEGSRLRPNGQLRPSRLHLAEHGVPLSSSAKSLPTPARAQRMVKQSHIGFAKSIMDYTFRWLQMRFLSGQQQFLFENLRPSRNRPQKE